MNSSRFVRRLTVISVFCSFTCVILADTWQPPAGSSLNWCDTYNWWLNDGPPTISDAALINSTPAGTAKIGPGCNAVAASLIVSQFNSPARAKVFPGGSLQVFGNTILGNYSATGTLEICGDASISGNLVVGYYYNPRGFGVVNVDGGWLEVGGSLKLGDQGGDGTLIMTGGVIDVTGTVTMLNGRIRLSGGILYANDLSFYPPNGTFDISGDSTVIIWRDLRNTYGHSADQITACGGNGTVIKEYYSNATIVRTACICPQGDITGDCKVNLQDLMQLSLDWLYGT